MAILIMIIFNNKITIEMGLKNDILLLFIIYIRVSHTYVFVYACMYMYHM